MAKRKHHEVGEGGDLQVGQTVWYYPAPGKDPGPHPGGEPLVAIVAHVLTLQSANLTVLAADGVPYGAQCVLLLKKGESALGNAFCTHDRLDDVEYEPSEVLGKQKAAAEENEAAVAAAKDAPAATEEGAKSPAPSAEEPPQEEMRV